MDPVCFMTDCLREFNYPNIQAMDDAEIMDIFSKTNRVFMVGWIFMHLDDDYREIVEKGSREELGNLVWSNGFCGFDEKDPFMDGECDVTLQVLERSSSSNNHEQLVTIFLKMFKYLRSISDSKKNTDIIPTVPILEIESLLQFDTNLFPMYGTKQALGPMGQIEKIRKYFKEIENMKNLIDTTEKINKEINPVSKNQLKSAMENLDMNFSLFVKRVLDSLKNRDSSHTSNAFLCRNLEEMLEKSSEYLNIILKFIKSVNVVTTFKEDLPEIKDVVNNNSKVAIRELSELCSDISSLRKDNT